MYRLRTEEIRDVLRFRLRASTREADRTVIREDRIRVRAARVSTRADRVRADRDRASTRTDRAREDPDRASRIRVPDTKIMVLTETVADL